jgi:hypothetical protein
MNMAVSFHVALCASKELLVSHDQDAAEIPSAATAGYNMYSIVQKKNLKTSCHVPEKMQYKSAEAFAVNSSIREPKKLSTYSSTVLFCTFSVT